MECHQTQRRQRTTRKLGTAPTDKELSEWFWIETRIKQESYLSSLLLGMIIDFIPKATLVLIQQSSSEDLDFADHIVPISGSVNFFFFISSQTRAECSPKNGSRCVVFTVLCCMCNFQPDTSDFSRRSLSYTIYLGQPRRCGLHLNAVHNRLRCYCLRHICPPTRRVSFKTKCSRTGIFIQWNQFRATISFYHNKNRHISVTLI